MERVEGIGGFFFIAHDPEALATWYAERLGVDRPPSSYDAEVWTPTGRADGVRSLR